MIRAQLARLRRSRTFTGSERLLEFLGFVVTETLKGGGALREVVIGNTVYGREPPYDPRIDSTVRVEARRLRGKLKEYYAGEGQMDPVRISLPTGGYVPEFALQPDPAEAREPHPSGGEGIFREGMGAAIAIMPFRSLSAEAEDESFADGLTDELIFRLQLAQGLRVVSRSITFQFKGQVYSLAGAARELGVDAIVQGTVRREDDMLRVTIEVADPQGFVVWTDRFDAPARERLRLQERIAITALSRVRFDSSAMRSSKIGPRPSALKALGAVYRGRQLLDEQTPGSIRAALQVFELVAANAPDYARGYSGIADCHCDLYRLGLVDHDTALREASAAVRAALAVDPGSVEAHTAQATIAAWLEWNRVAADEGFRKAAQLGENARASRLHGVLLTIMARHGEAERLFREARTIEPLSIQQDIAETISRYQARDFGSVRAASPGAAGRSAEVLVYRALAHAFDGDAEAVRSQLAEIERVTDKFPDLMLAAAELQALLGAPERGMRIIDGELGASTHFARAMLAAALGRDQLCLDMLEKAMDRRELSAVWIRTDARLDRLRHMPRFSALMERLNAFVPTDAADLADPLATVQP
ncbi:conserved hypothetical protein [Mesorhizobium plurifarium]|uniref:Adenylate cyclase n=1 Tax=Mesorhizobium plurifarium TaxID=69974 RepID=A0A0K2W3P5_MESPL|nr:conserved hypothetical protein [Mesorhizobium plurifarium]